MRPWGRLRRGVLALSRNRPDGRAARRWLDGASGAALDPRPRPQDGLATARFGRFRRPIITGQLEKNYDAAFYANQKAGSLASAEIVLNAIKPLLSEVRSVLDIGCGAGGWLRTAAGAFPGAQVFGVDHPNVPHSEMFIAPECFAGRDLSAPIDLERRFDLVISLEVAEHIDPDKADLFIDILTRHGEKVLFSAATPNQGGTGHVNEQWPFYWADKFAARGLRCYDIVRPLIWDEDDVASWYKQNIILYGPEALAGEFAAQEDWDGRAMVHPGLWMRKTEPFSARLSRAVQGRKPGHDWRKG